jgi:hypothetical protein
MVFVIFAYFENICLNIDPNMDQHRVNKKPINAKSMAKPNRVKNCLE